MRDMDRLEPWLDDGNVVLSVEGKHFRVHRTVLCSYSEIFKDMFSIPHSDDAEEKIGGCPVVHLQDAVTDVQNVLKALYDRSHHFFFDGPVPVDVLEAFLRLGKKYAIRHLFEEAKRRLSFDQPPLVYVSTVSATRRIQLFPRVSGNDLFNFRVMNIANEVGLLTLVVVAIFYACIACPALSIADGYNYDDVWCTLSAANQRYFILAHRFLADAGRILSRSLLSPMSSCQHRATAQSPCLAEQYLTVRRYLELGRPFMQWGVAWDRSFCVNCGVELRGIYDGVRATLWQSLPVELGLGRWEDLDKDTEIL